MKADFYIGLGDNARWLGSIATDGGPAEVGRVHDLFNTSGDVADYTEDSFTDAVARIVRDVDADDDSKRQGWLAADDDVWPWPYPSSTLTDYTYAWNNGCIHVFEEGYMVAQHYPNGARRPSAFRNMNPRKHPANPVAGKEVT